MKVVVTITGIRPDFIRMSQVFKKLDQHFHHVLIHTGQHYDKVLSDVFFEQLDIRKPDFILDTGKTASNHYEQLSYLSLEIPRLLQSINPDIVLFLGDSNSASVALPVKKEGYKIGHIEAGMRSYDKRMLEEINRTVCDHCSDILFVYHQDYKEQVARENLTENVYVVGNTIVEPFRMHIADILSKEKRKDMILLDIHRPENFKYKYRLQFIFNFANECIDKYKIPVKMLYFKRLKDAIEIENLNIGKIEMINLLPYKEYMELVYHSRFLISDSGTAQEEPALLHTPVIVPRDYTERPQSFKSNCSYPLYCEKSNKVEVYEYLDKIERGELQIDVTWLGEGNTSDLIIEHIKNYLENTKEK
jgi:UDP-N-acetylglucosamine 2-epimerase